jgi:hypothetical protein
MQSILQNLKLKGLVSFFSFFLRSPYAPRVGVTQMWILRKSKDLLEYIHSRFFSELEIKGSG